jgi:putative CocE/NonD family hydrolase
MAATGTYPVDLAPTSGAFNRWAAQRGGLVFYGNRQGLPDNRLTFDAPAVDANFELVGSAELCLVMSSDQTDGLVIATLEDVAPDGRVTYLSEGILRLIHRKSAEASCDTAPGVTRSYNKADGAPVVPGEMMKIEFELLPVAALIRKGHHLRLALTGADAGWFEGLTDTPATWTVAYGVDGSQFSVPMRPWTE